MSAFAHQPYLIWACFRSSAPTTLVAVTDPGKCRLCLADDHTDESCKKLLSGPSSFNSVTGERFGSRFPRFEAGWTWDIRLATTLRCSVPCSRCRIRWPRSSCSWSTWASPRSTPAPGAERRAERRAAANLAKADFSPSAFLRWGLPWEVAAPSHLQPETRVFVILFGGMQSVCSAAMFPDRVLASEVHSSRP